MKNWKELQKQAETLPRGEELGTVGRYKVMLSCIDALDRTWPWEFQKRKLLKTIFERAAFPNPPKE